MALQPRRFQRSERRPSPGPPRDVAALPDLVHGRSRSGPVRTERPVYVDLLPPCNSACPAGEDIQGYLAQVQAGEHERAWRILVADNPFAAIHGRVCYHPCETSCNRAQLDSAVSIHSVERFLGDLALERGWHFDPPAARTGRRVLVIGAGPSGLSAACHLARLGHEVELRDAGAEPGGMMRYGIPAYRLPRDVLDARGTACRCSGPTRWAGTALRRALELSDRLYSDEGRRAGDRGAWSTLPRSRHQPERAVSAGRTRAIAVSAGAHTGPGYSLGNGGCQIMPVHAGACGSSEMASTQGF